MIEIKIKMYAYTHEVQILFFSEILTTLYVSIYYVHTLSVTVECALAHMASCMKSPEVWFSCS